MTDFSQPPLPPLPQNNSKAPQFFVGVLIFVVSQTIAAMISAGVAATMLGNGGTPGIAFLVVFHSLVLLGPAVFLATKQRWASVLGYFALPILGLLLLGSYWLAFGA